VIQRQPQGPAPAPAVQRIRLRYAKRGRLRFSSHRDFARAFERALRRAEVPMAYSAGFHPHPKISYLGAAPTGAASEAEYVEIALTEHRPPDAVRAAVDAALPDGLDLTAAVDAEHCPPGSLADQLTASLWRIEVAADPEVVRAAVAILLAVEAAPVERPTKDGRRTVDARPPLRCVTVAADPDAADRAILDVVVSRVTPTVRPDDVLTALHSVAGFAPSLPPRSTRLAQGPLDEDGSVADPFRSTL
jgi:radical SAM-linked protein